MLDKKEFKKIFSSRLKKSRIKKGLTQPELAKLIGSTDRNISNYETGYSFPSIIVLYKLSIALSTSIDYLFGFTDNPQINKKDEDLSIDDYSLLNKLKSEEILYEYLISNDFNNIHYINKIINLFEEWKEE